MIDLLPKLIRWETGNLQEIKKIFNSSCVRFIDTIDIIQGFERYLIGITGTICIADFQLNIYYFADNCVIDFALGSVKTIVKQLNLDSTKWDVRSGGVNTYETN